MTRHYGARRTTTLNPNFINKDGRHGMSASDEGHDPQRGTISQQDRDEIRRRSEGLGKRLDKIQARGRPSRAADGPERGAAYGQAFRIAGELIAGLVVGGAIGWFLDSHFGTKPLLFAVFLMLGFAAGLLNVIRAAKQMQAKAEPLQRSAPSVADDEEDDR